MQRINQQRHLFYLLAAILLLLQSFAVWHDATHPFHTAEAQCERFDAINHLPGADLVAELALPVRFVSIPAEIVTEIPALPAKQQEQHPIRAPPFFS